MLFGICEKCSFRFYLGFIDFDLYFIRISGFMCIVEDEKGGKEKG